MHIFKPCTINNVPLVRTIKFQSRVLAARGFKEAKEDKETKRMQDEIREMKESLESITKLLEKK